MIPIETPPLTRAAADLTSRADIVQLVDAFYERVRRDSLLGPIFDDVARVDWPAHLPRMYDFWETVLFGSATFKGDPLAVHRDLARLTPLTAREFDHWVDLFHRTIDDHFAGPGAHDAKLRAARIAVNLQRHIRGG